MNGYLKKIWNRLVRCYRLKVVRDAAGQRVLQGEVERERLGRGTRNYEVRVTRHVLTFHKKQG